MIIFFELPLLIVGIEIQPHEVNYLTVSRPQNTYLPSGGRLPRQEFLPHWAQAGYQMAQPYPGGSFNTPQKDICSEHPALTDRARPTTGFWLATACAWRMWRVPRA